jgi:peptide-methionine (S)-S-oxide reductase
MTDDTETAILGGGCFWEVQDLLRHRDGVISTRVGYTGGENANPTYGHHPGHAEALEIVFDRERISYRDILELFLQIHDPTTKDRQGNDIGSDYPSEIFSASAEQRRVAEETIGDVDASGLWPGKVVTAISAAGPFWEAEPEHQDYLQRYPRGYNCHFPRRNRKLPAANTRPRAPGLNEGARMSLISRGFQDAAVTPTERVPPGQYAGRDVTVLW